jgi:hypothetical protein
VNVQASSAGAGVTIDFAGRGGMSAATLEPMLVSNAPSVTTTPSIQLIFPVSAIALLPTVSVVNQRIPFLFVFDAQRDVDVDSIDIADDNEDMRENCGTSCSAKSAACAEVTTSRFGGIGVGV